MAIYSKTNTFSANTTIVSSQVNTNFDEISTAINTTLCGGGSAVIPASGGTGRTTLTAYALVAGNGTSTVGLISPSSQTTYPLFSAGSSSNPAYRAIASTDLPQIRSSVACNTGNGTGSSNTCIMKFTNSTTTGSDITYATSSTAGDTFTINTAGVYAMNLVFEGATNTVANAGISLNSSQLTTAISGITAADRIAWGYSAAVAADNSAVSCSVTIALAANDVIRAHTTVSPTNTSSRTQFRITRVAV